jgi:regulator of sirC expression with transglutaminase-like and TPR domain
MRQVLHSRLGFHGNELDYYAPDNSFLNRAIMAPASRQLIVRRMLANLVNAYDQRHDGARAELARGYAAVLES